MERFSERAPTSTVSPSPEHSTPRSSLSRSCACAVWERLWAASNAPANPSIEGVNVEKDRHRTCGLVARRVLFGHAIDDNDEQLFGCAKRKKRREDHWYLNSGSRSAVLSANGSRIAIGGQ